MTIKWVDERKKPFSVKTTETVMPKRDDMLRTDTFQYLRKEHKLRTFHKLKFYKRRYEILFSCVTKNPGYNKSNLSWINMMWPRLAIPFAPVIPNHFQDLESYWGEQQ